LDAPYGSGTVERIASRQLADAAALLLHIAAYAAAVRVEKQCTHQIAALFCVK